MFCISLLKSKIIKKQIYEVEYTNSFEHTHIEKPPPPVRNWIKKYFKDDNDVKKERYIRSYL